MLDLSEIIQRDTGFPMILNTFIFNVVPHFIRTVGYTKYLTLWILSSTGFGKVLDLSEIINEDASFQTIPNTWVFEAFSNFIPTVG